MSARINLYFKGPSEPAYVYGDDRFVVVAGYAGREGGSGRGAVIFDGPFCQNGQPGYAVVALPDGVIGGCVTGVEPFGFRGDLAEHVALSIEPGDVPAHLRYPGVIDALYGTCRGDYHG